MVILLFRALAGWVDRRPGPCHVYNSISWLTQSVDVIHKSHLATEEFYKGVTVCNQMLETAINPNKTRTRKFVFT
jgi:hypothetical protein